MTIFGEGAWICMELEMGRSLRVGYSFLMFQPCLRGKRRTYRIVSWQDASLWMSVGWSSELYIERERATEIDQLNYQLKLIYTSELTVTHNRSGKVSDHLRKPVHVFRASGFYRNRPNNNNKRNKRTNRNLKNLRKRMEGPARSFQKNHLFQTGFPWALWCTEQKQWCSVEVMRRKGVGWLDRILFLNLPPVLWQLLRHLQWKLVEDSLLTLKSL